MNTGLVFLKAHMHLGKQNGRDDRGRTGGKGNWGGLVQSMVHSYMIFSNN